MLLANHPTTYFVSGECQSSTCNQLTNILVPGTNAITDPNSFRLTATANGQYTLEAFSDAACSKSVGSTTTVSTDKCYKTQNVCAETQPDECGMCDDNRRRRFGAKNSELLHEPSVLYYEFSSFE